MMGRMTHSDVSAAGGDWRWAGHGRQIPAGRYCDQPYVARTADGAWLCTVTTAGAEEGARGQHVIAMRSTDQGRNWSAPVPLEPADGPEASYAVLLVTPAGRVYCFYNYNSRNRRRVRAETGEDFRRVDSLGDYVFKYSDDHGRSWSPTRYRVPVRMFQCDRENVYRGRVRFFWNVGRPFVIEAPTGVSVYCSLHKVGAMGQGFFAQSEGVLLRSDNLWHESDPRRLRWETLPAGEVGLRAPAGGGRIAEEQSYSVLSDGTIHVVYRTVDGHPAESYSRDGGRTWDAPRYRCYADGRRMKHPRAANFAWRCANGRWLYWFHNHGGPFVPRLDPCGYEDRNPVWLCAGREVRTPRGLELEWSQPEIALYDDDPYIRMSYPDLVEEDGRLFLTETNKAVARTHELDAAFLATLWGQFDACETVRAGLILETPRPGRPVPARIQAPRLPRFTMRDPDRADYGTRHTRRGFSLELWLTGARPRAVAPLVDGRTPDGRGLLVEALPDGALALTLSDGRTVASWTSDPAPRGRRGPRHAVIVVDGGPRLISFVCDGRFADGGNSRQFGWGRFSQDLREANGAAGWRLAGGARGPLRGLRVYDRALMTSEAIANARAHAAGNGTGNQDRRI